MNHNAWFRLYGGSGPAPDAQAAAVPSPPASGAGTPEGAASPPLEACASGDLGHAGGGGDSSARSNRASVLGGRQVAGAGRGAVSECADEARGGGQVAGGLLEGEVLELRYKLAAALELIGERDEAIERLRLDLAESRAAYREQLDLMAARLAAFEAQHRRVKWLGAAAEGPVLAAAAASGGGAAVEEGPHAAVTDRKASATAFAAAAAQSAVVEAAGDGAGGGVSYGGGGGGAASDAGRPAERRHALRGAASAPGGRAAAGAGAGREGGAALARPEVPAMAAGARGRDRGLDGAKGGSADGRALLAGPAAAPPLPGWTGWAPCVAPRRRAVWAGPAARSESYESLSETFALIL